MLDYVEKYPKENLERCAYWLRAIHGTQDFERLIQTWREHSERGDSVHGVAFSDGVPRAVQQVMVAAMIEMKQQVTELTERLAAIEKKQNPDPLSHVARKVS